MDHSGRAFKQAIKLSFWSLVLLLALLAAGVVAIFLGNLIAAISSALVGLWALYAIAVFYLLRDPDPLPLAGLPKAVVSPSHGRVEAIGEADEPLVFKGSCRRISIKVSLFDVHVHKSPVDGVATYCQDIPDQPRPTLLIGIVPREASREVMAIRITAGTHPRAIQCWVKAGDLLERGARMALLQFGTRCEFYLPLSAEIQVKPGDRLRGGETILACLA